MDNDWVCKAALPGKRGDRLAGKVALVTGIAAGIGRGVALMFAQQGATVVGCDIDALGAQATVDAAAAQGLAIDSLHPLDLTQPEQVTRLVEHAVAALSAGSKQWTTSGTGAARWWARSTSCSWHARRHGRS